jgi:hypothetical protein
VDPYCKVYHQFCSDNCENGNGDMVTFFASQEFSSQAVSNKGKFEYFV